MEEAACGARNGWSWRISSQWRVVCDTRRGQRAGRADRSPGRCRAGEGVAWRHYLTGRFVSWAYSAALAAQLRRALLTIHFLPEVGGRFVVDLRQGRQRAQEGGVPLA